MITGKIYKNFNQLLDEARLIISVNITGLKVRGFKAAMADGPIFDQYEVPWGDRSGTPFPAVCVNLPFIAQVNDERQGRDNAETLFIGIRTIMLKTRDMRFLIYPKARKPHGLFDVVTPENHVAYIRESCESDINDVARTPMNVQNEAVDSINVSYKEINELCGAGETLLVHKAHVQVIKTLPPPPERIRLTISNFAIPFYVVFTKKIAKELFAERCQAKKNRKRPDSAIKSMNRERLRRAT